MPDTHADGLPETRPELRTVVSGRVDFSAQLESFQGPLDLLLYLIKENEVEITEIPIARILQQYLTFIDAAQTDLQLAGEFLVMAATLMEIKSRELLPVQAQPLEGDEIIEDPRSELVRQLLEYRRLKEQAQGLERMQEQWQQQRPRGLFGDVPEPPDTENPDADRATAKEALLEVDLYALFAAYERILNSVLAQTPRNIVYDQESLEEKITRIERILKVRPFARFVELLTDPRNRADVAGTFVALLELVRRRAVRLVQPADFQPFDVKAQSESEAEELSRQEAEAAEAAAAQAVDTRQAAEAAAAQAAAVSGEKLPWKRKAARPKFEGIVRPEDVEELDAEENEIGRRIDAILAAADAISDRFEQSREGRVRDDAPPEGDPNAQPVAAPAAQTPVPPPETPA